ncbi:MAG: pancreas/duodenum homeobox protein 1 [Desulfotignum sp.]|nr:pancreas/duodenum homeobox protein 1 [Desulfotignum sp.]MCF8112302.1 pancreas/duodenum homeobox protein 1 [Desulfotignum sp.]MCF8125208.1 pancreas/duodenum homeobox protein 1 [Desulfotignum sp.]
MNQTEMDNIFTQKFCDELLPPQTSDRFFEALYGDVSEGAYDIRLECVSIKANRVVLAFNLTQRPGKCLVCSLTYGLPNVFARHPLINIKGMIQKIKEAGVPVKEWQLGQTCENTNTLHVIPLYIDLAES